MPTDTSTNPPGKDISPDHIAKVVELFSVLVEMDLEQRKKRKEVSHGRHDKDITTSTQPDEAGQSAI